MSAPTKPKKRPAKKAVAAPKKKPSPMEGAIRPPSVPIYPDEKITPAGAWNQTTQDGFVVELPSGNFAKLRRTLSLPTLLSSGKIPNPLADMIRKMISVGKSDIKAEDLGEEGAIQFATLVNEQIPLIFASPRVESRPDGWDTSKQGAWEPSPGAMDINMLSFEDQMYAFSWAQGAALDIATFRERANASMATVQHGEGMAQESG